MARFKLKIEYQGSKYSGWQIQKNARTVQGEIQGAIQRATGRAAFDFQGAGRTDAGVHALEQVAHLDIAAGLPPELLRIRVNDELPSDISILSLETAPHRFHARHHAVARSYLYQISRRRTAFGKKLVWWVREDLDLDRMRQAAALFPGMRDCRSFSADDPEEKSTKVLIDRVDLAECGDLVLLRVAGSHFLWKMVRRIVGVIVAAGRGELEVADVRRFLTVESQEPARLAAPASGLFLERVYYEGERQLERLDPVIRIGSPSHSRPKPTDSRSQPDRRPMDYQAPARRRAMGFDVSRIEMRVMFSACSRTPKPGSVRSPCRCESSRPWE